MLENVCLLNRESKYDGKDLILYRNIINKIIRSLFKLFEWVVLKKLIFFYYNLFIMFFFILIL